MKIMENDPLIWKKLTYSHYMYNNYCTCEKKIYIYIYHNFSSKTLLLTAVYFFVYAPDKRWTEQANAESNKEMEGKPQAVGM